MYHRTKTIQIGTVAIGNGAEIAVQSMTTVPPSDVESTLLQINRLQQAGCSVVRVAVPTMADAEAIAALKQRTSVPIVADVHFDWRLAVAAIRSGADKIRINPGNVGLGEGLDCVIAEAKRAGIPIRIGINGGSLPAEFLKDEAAGMAELMRRYVRYFEERGFFDLVLSAKSSDVATSSRVNRLLAQAYDYPIHIGLTEAGTAERGILKSAVVAGALLTDGIGDTLRVSLTDDPVREAEAALEILQAVGKKKDFVEVISCPTCGRCRIDLIPLAQAVSEHVKGVKKSMKIAVMGCAVNGPGEAKNADLGLAGGDGKAVFFKKGKIFKSVSDSENILAEFLREIDRELNEK